MKLHILSDLHLEFSGGEMDHSAPEGTDVVILPGDIQPGVEGLIWAAETFGSSMGMPVIFTPGNHEYWGDRDLLVHNDIMRSTAEGLGIHFLLNDEVVIDDVRFLGCTLWTDLNLLGDQPLAIVRAMTDTKDYQQIYYTADQRLQPFHTVEEHKTSLNFLTESLNTPFDGKTVVVTHHAPSEQSCLPKFHHHNANYCYASNLDRFVEAMAPELWCHGHMHQNQDYLIGTTRVICNPRGYDEYEPNPDFDPQLVVDI